MTSLAAPLALPTAEPRDALRAALQAELLALVVQQARRVPPQTIGTTALLSLLVGQYLPSTVVGT